MGIKHTAYTVTDEQIRDLLASCMNSSPLSEDCLVALEDLVLDDGDPDDNIAMALDRIAVAINARAKGTEAL